MLPQADVVTCASTPGASSGFLEANRDRFKPGALVTDVCGIKTAIVEARQVLPRGVDFIGCHPMAGTEFSGIEHAVGDSVPGVPLHPHPRASEQPGAHRPAGAAGRLHRLQGRGAHHPQEHDAIIAYTSQIMHIIAVSVCDDPDLFDCKGFEGGSFRDCTRVAALDVPLWTQLFSMNAPALCTVIRTLEDNLRAYREVIERGDTQALAAKLAWSADRKRHMNLE